MKKIILLSSVLLSLLFNAQTPAYVPTSGLVAWWGFNGAANDSSGNGNNLTVTGATLTNDRNGMPNAAYAFDGSGYLSKSFLSYTFSQTGSFSVSFWMMKANNNEGVAMMSGSGTSDNFIWLVQCDAFKTIYGTTKQGQAWVWVNAPAYSTSNWEHYVAVFNNQSMELYKNGASVGTGTNSYTNTLQAALPFYIGRAISGGNIVASIDDVGIWNRVLTPTEITQLYSSTLSTNEIGTSSAGSIAPNPAGDFIQINLPVKSSQKYKITDINGRLVSQGNISNEKKINVSQLSKGIYFIEIEGVKSLKFLKK
jgi:hypothetical protein